jgi:hypothetical protein
LIQNLAGILRNLGKEVLAEASLNGLGQPMLHVWPFLPQAKSVIDHQIGNLIIPFNPGIPLIPR